MDEDEIVDKTSHRIARDINIGIVPVLIAVRYGYDPRANEYRFLERAVKVITHIVKSPRFIRLNTLRLVAVIPRNILTKSTAQTMLEMLDKEGIEYSSYSYVIDEGQIVSLLLESGFEHKEATILIDLVKAFPGIINKLRQGDEPLPERIRDAVRQELGEEYEFVADVYAEALRLGRRLSIKEAKRVTNLNKAFREDITKSLKIID